MLVNEIMSELGISQHEVAFEEFYAVLTEIEKQDVQDQKKPSLAMFAEVKPEAKQETEELIIEIDTKILDVLRQEQGVIIIDYWKSLDKSVLTREIIMKLIRRSKSTKS